MRFVIFGTGGAGGYFGVQLAAAGQDVVFIARGEHLKAIKANGLRLEMPNGETTIRAEATDDPSKVGTADAVLIGVKAWQVKDAAQAIRPVVGSQTIVVPLQNGVEAASDLSAVLGAQHVLGGLCGTFSFVAGPGHIRNMGGANFIRFGEQDNRRTDRVERLRQVIAAAGVAAEAPPDITKATWDKFLLVTSQSVGAVARAPLGVIRASPGTRSLIQRCAQEALNVARARKVAMADTAVDDTLKFIDGIPPAATNSLQRDIAAGKPSELDYWNGAVVRLGREAGVPTPGHTFIYDCLLPQELRARGKADFQRL